MIVRVRRGLGERDREDGSQERQEAWNSISQERTKLKSYFTKEDNGKNTRAVTKPNILFDVKHQCNTLIQQCLSDTT